MKLGIFFVVIMGGILFGLSQYDGKTARKKVWDNAKHERLPASLFNDIDLITFQDFFSSSSLEDGIKYDITTDFWTNKDTDYLQEKSLESIREAILKTATAAGEQLPDEKIVLSKILKDNLIESFIGNFVKTLAVYKIINGVFQFDINFNPKNDHWTNYDNELSSNQLIRINQTGLLEEQLNDASKSVVDHIVDTTFKIPSSDNTYHYAGGVVTLWVKLLDILASPTQPLKLVDSFIRYRRYYRMNNAIEFTSLGIGGNSGMIDDIKKAPGEDNKYNAEFVTVDVYKKINRTTFAPYLDKADVYFGKLIPSTNRRENTINRTIAERPNIIKSSDYQINVRTVKDRQKYTYTVPLGVLSYSFIDKSFSHLLPPNVIGKDFDSEDADVKFANSLINRYGRDFINKLKLDRFHLLLKQDAQ